MEAQVLNNIGPLAQFGSFGLVVWVLVWAIKTISKMIESNQMLTERAVRAIDAITNELEKRPCMKDMAEIDRKGN